MGKNLKDKGLISLIFFEISGRSFMIGVQRSDTNRGVAARSCRLDMWPLQVILDWSRWAGKRRGLQQTGDSTNDAPILCHAGKAFLQSVLRGVGGPRVQHYRLAK